MAATGARRWTGGRRAAAALALAAALLGGSCRPGGSGAPSSDLTVVASFYPLYEAARRVAGPGARVVNLTPAGAEPHDLELTSRDLDAVLQADVVLYLGGGFQPALEEALGQRDGPSVDLLAAVGAGPGAAGGPPDPHVWLDPVLMARIVEEVAAVLGRVDPAGAAGYRLHARAYARDVLRLHREYRTALASCRTRTFVTSHAAFGRLAARYGLRQEAIAGLSPEAEPDPARLAELADLVRREGLTTVFTETLVSPAVAETLAREAGVRTAVLDPIEGLPPGREAAGQGYLSVMRANLAALTAALGCRRT